MLYGPEDLSNSICWHKKKEADNMGVQRTKDGCSLEIRGLLYAISYADDSLTIGGEKITKGSANYDDSCEYVLEILSNEVLQKLIEVSGRLKKNEQEVGKEILQTKYASAYTKLKKEFYDAALEYIIQSVNRTKLLWMRDWCTSEDFMNGLQGMLKTSAMKDALKSREVTAIRKALLDSKFLALVNERQDAYSISVGNYEIPCKTKQGYSHIAWCKNHCEKYENCEVLAKASKENPFDYSLWMNLLETSAN